MDVRTDTRVRRLDVADLAAVRRVLDQDPVTNTFVDSKVSTVGMDNLRLGAELWGYEEYGELTALCYVGANVVPVQADLAAARAFGDFARSRVPARRCSSIWGPRDAVRALWERVAPVWGPARAVRDNQPFMVLDSMPAMCPDPCVRPVRPDEFELLYPTSVAFFLEELGVSPEAGGAASFYRSRVSDLLWRHRAFARFEGGRVAFKAEVGIETRKAFQVQGVWVRPDRRGSGLAAPGVAAVVAAGMRSVAPVATLYVNAFNESARRAYRTVGFEDHSTFMTVLF